MDAAEPILDEAHLVRQTFGDRLLEREILDLFIAQLAALAPRLERAAGRERHELLHGLKGSARAVGAAALARLAERLEEGGEAQLQAGLPGLLAATLDALARRRG